MSQGEIIREVAQQQRARRNDRQSRNKVSEDAQRSLVSMFLDLPGTISVWSGGSYRRSDPRWIDLMGGNNNLQDNGATNPVFGYDTTQPLISMVTMDSAQTQYYSKADGGANNWADITGTEASIATAQRGMTIYCICRFTNAASVDEYVVNKLTVAGNQRSYRMYRRSTGILRVSVSVDGAAITNANTTDTISQDVWYMLTLQYSSTNTELSSWINDGEAGPIAAPASIFDSTAPFEVGARTGAETLSGDIAIVSLHAAWHSNARILSVYHQADPLFNFGG